MQFFFFLLFEKFTVYYHLRDDILLKATLELTVMITCSTWVGV